MNLPEEKFSALLEKIKSSKSVLILTHENPDGDAVGALSGCFHLLNAAFPGKKITAICPSFPSVYDYLSPGKWLGKMENIDVFDLILILDCGCLNRTGISEMLKGKFLVNIDHHSDNDGFGNLNYVYPEASSACEIVFVLAKNLLSMPLPAEISKALYTGLITDSGSFRFSSTSSFTHQAASFLLLSKNADFSQVISRIYFEEPYAKIGLLGKIISQMKLEDGICYSQIKSKDFAQTGCEAGMTEGLVNVMIGIKEAKLAVLFQEMPDLVKISFRSRGKVDCQKISHQFKGGGHKEAAGAKVNGKIDEVRNSVISKIKVMLK